MDPWMQVEQSRWLIRKYGNIDGAHHKQWVLNEVLKVLSDGREHLEDEGTAP